MEDLRGENMTEQNLEHQQEQAPQRQEQEQQPEPNRTEQGRTQEQPEQNPMLNEQLQREKENKASWNIRPYLAVGLTAFIVITASMALFFIILRYRGLGDYWKLIMGILQPIVFGLGFAYLINPLVRWEEQHLLKFFLPHTRNEEKTRKRIRLISVFAAILVVVLLVTLLLNMVIPELISSVSGMISQLPQQVNNFTVWLQGYVGADSELPSEVEEILTSLITYAKSWMEQNLLPQTTTVLASLTSGVISAVKAFLNVIIGVIISVYVLTGKETFTGQAKKIVYGILSPSKGNVVIETARKSNEIFSGFISGKILDSAIIGVLCFLGLTILHMPYTVLVSVIVGVTNVIPFFGPYLGAIPSAALILLADPLKGLYFIIFIIVLQQLDGNIIGPGILGESTGLTSFWVVFSILIGGGLFGFIGMLLGVPVFATIYYVIKRIFAHVLRKKGLPVETAAYIKAARVDPETRVLDYEMPEKAKKSSRRKKKKG